MRAPEQNAAISGSPQVRMTRVTCRRRLAMSWTMAVIWAIGPLVTYRHDGDVGHLLERLCEDLVWLSAIVLQTQYYRRIRRGEIITEPAVNLQIERRIVLGMLGTGCALTAIVLGAALMTHTRPTIDWLLGALTLLLAGVFIVCRAGYARTSPPMA